MVQLVVHGLGLLSGYLIISI